MRPEELESELLLYWIQYRELEEKGGPEKDGELFEVVLGQEEAILETFGLPLAEKYNKILWKLAEKKSCSPKTVQKTLEKLRKTAQVYHSKPVKPSLQLLKEAQVRKIGFADLLPELGFVTHTYSIFLYENLLLKKIATAEVILQELQTVHELELYGPIANLQNNLAPNYRRTKAYKNLKAKLRFLNAFLNLKDDVLTFPERETETDFDDLFHGMDQERLPPAKPYKPEYQLLLNHLEIEEIIFDDTESVTVNVRYFEPGMPKRFGLGFEFDEFYQLLLAYCRPNLGVLSYFNKNRQHALLETPNVIVLKEKLGKNQPLDQHYLRVYKPQTIDRDGRQVLLEDNFYMVDEILDKRRFDTEQQHELRSEINGWFGHYKNWYPIYLNAKAKGLSEMEARKSIGIENQHLFELSRLLYFLEKHGGKAEIKDLR